MSPQDLAILTEREVELLRDLQQVDEHSLWGYSMKRCLKHITAFGFCSLVCDLKSQADDGADAMKRILGEQTFSKLLSL